MSEINAMPQLSGAKKPMDFKALREANPFDKLDANKNGKLEGTELTVAKTRIPGISFDSRDEETGIDSADYELALRSVEQKQAA